MESISEMSKGGISSGIEDKLYRSLLSSAESARDKACLASIALTHAGDGILVVPSPALGLQLRSPEFRAAVLYRLGIPIFGKEGDCVACGQFSDIYGDHAIVCASGGERIARHNHL